MIGLILSVALISSAPQASTGSSGNNSTASKPATSSDDEIVCRRERSVGSNRPVRICYTRKQWRDMQDNARRMMDEGGRGGPEGRPDNNTTHTSPQR